MADFSGKDQNTEMRAAAFDVHLIGVDPDYRIHEFGQLLQQ